MAVLFVVSNFEFEFQTRDFNIIVSLITIYNQAKFQGGSMNLPKVSFFFNITKHHPFRFI